MKHYAMKTSDGNVIFIQFVETTNINDEVSKWEQTSGGITVESILELQGLPETREEREELREELKTENV